MISIKSRHILLIVATLIMFAVPAIGNAAWCTGADDGKFNYGAGCVAPPNPDATLNTLIFGNQSSATGNVKHLKDNSTSAARATQYTGQKPSAIVLTCSDSRVPPEIIFNRALGEIFTVRVAGNVVAEHEIGSIEYAIEHLGANLVVVLGHERCGAVQATFDAHASTPTETAGQITAKLAALGPNLGSLVTSIDPAVEAVFTQYGGKSTDALIKATQVEACIVENTRLVTESLEAKSLIIKEFVEAGKVKIVQGKYDLDDGLVSFSAIEPPREIVVPATNNSGSFEISWPKSTESGVNYILETTNNDGGTWTSMYTGKNNYYNAAGITNGTYKYRVKTAKSGYADSEPAISSASVVFLTAAVPATIFVPLSNNTGNFEVSWAKSNTAGAQYTLESCTNAGCTSPTLVATAIPNNYYNVSVATAGTYYYRVKTTKGGIPDSGYITSNACIVSTAGINGPAAIWVPATNSTGTFEINWARSSVPGVQYTLESCTDAGCSSPTVQVAGIANNYSNVTVTAGTYYFRVKATKGGMSDSAYVTSLPCTVASVGMIAPSLLWVPATNSTGSVEISWTRSTVSGAQYTLEYSVDNATWTQVTNIPTNYKSVTLTTGFSYYFRVKTTKPGQTDSAYTTSTTTCAVALACDAPFAIWVPANSSTGSFEINWARSMVSGVTYTLETSADGSTGWVSAGSPGVKNYFAITGAASGTHYYRVKATKAGGYADSGWKVSTVVTVP